MRYGTGDWDREVLGNHRVVLCVAEAAEAVRAEIPWRRRDQEPEKKNVIVVCRATGERVRNVLRLAVSREVGDFVFEATRPGEYFLYFLPYHRAGKSDFRKTYFPSTAYDPPEDTADPGWADGAAADPDGLPRAEVVGMQAINDFHRFDPMEVPATATEMAALLAEYPGRTYLLFPEDRRHPIRMQDELPHRWIASGPSEAFRGDACRGEFYAFQIGVFAARGGVEAIVVATGDLSGPSGSVIAGDAFRCVSLGGIDWLGRPFRKHVSVAKGAVQPLWFGVQVPRDAPPGDYEGALTLTSANAPPTEVRLTLTVTDDALDDAGDGEPWRHARLRWLDSTIGLDDEATEPYPPVEVEGRTVKVLGRSLTFGETGLPESIRSTFSWGVDRADAEPTELLAGPARLVVAEGAESAAWSGGRAEITRRAPGAVAWQATSTAGHWRLGVRARMECDGYVSFRLTLGADAAAVVKDIALELPLRREIATYLVGLGHKGGSRPAEWRWGWDARRSNNHFWIGDVRAGLRCKLKHVDEDWAMTGLERTGLYRDWSNGGQGGCTLTEEGDVVLVRAFTGERSVEAGEELHFNFSLLITPVKVLDKEHWRRRYVHHSYPEPVEEEAATGATIINLHHGTKLNPYINYPFLTADRLKAHADAAHERGMKVKFYYTVRELTTRTVELWALHSLGDEVFLDGPGFADPEALAAMGRDFCDHTGGPWLCEHLRSGYIAQWHQPLEDGNCDVAIATVGLSRWHNYYLEGLRWMLEHAGLDGLYLDGIGYDREIMKRVRKVMQRTRPGCLIDFHSGDTFSGPFGQSSTVSMYAEHLPYIDRIWFGEGYDYENTPPEYWLTEISGIPFGLFGEMLQDGGNPWRGMLYGMTNRLGWGGYKGDNPAMWRVWDAFGIHEAEMIGYWVPDCPVRTGHPDALATVYRREGRALVAVASWAKERADARLDIAWDALGIEPSAARIRAPAIHEFQEAVTFAPGEAIPVEPGRGWLLLVEGRAGAR